LAVIQIHLLDAPMYTNRHLQGWHTGIWMHKILKTISYSLNLI